MQVIPERVVDPDGLSRADQWDPPSVVAITPVPTATQSSLDEQATAFKTDAPLGADSSFQVVPPSFVPKMAAPPPAEAEATAKHTSTLIHETPWKSAAISGALSRNHVIPPSLVAMMLGLLFKLLLTAWQTLAFTHETPVRDPTP
jgi:hypothetical protein